MLFPQIVCVVRGGGDLATGVVYRLQRVGFPVVVLELEQPRVVRRMASVAQAMYTSLATVAGLTAERMTAAEAARLLDAAAAPGPQTVIPVVADPDGAILARLRPKVVVDGRMAKAAQDTTRQSADFVLGLGPGFVAGENCHAVVETNRGHDLGRVIWLGQPQPDTRLPEPVLGYDVDRVLRAPVAGVLRARREIGELIAAGDLIAEVDGQRIVAPFEGVLRGLVYDGLTLAAGEKAGDLDPRKRRDACFTISDKALAVGGGALEAILTWLNEA